MVDQLLTAPPGTALQVMVTKGIVKQLRLIEPGGMCWSETRSPPGVVLEVNYGSRRRMTGIAVLDQKHPAPVPVALSKVLQGLKVMVAQCQ